jgi:hypothetical protein
VLYTTLYIYSVLCLSLSLSLSRMCESKGFRPFSVGMGTKEDESSTRSVRAAGFHHVTARSHLARVLKLVNRLFI